MMFGKKDNSSRTLFSPVEKAFYELSGSPEWTTRIPYVLVDNFPRLGFFTALRFLEWVGENPEGVISLPTGKTPEFFIKWTRHFLDKWEDPKVRELREKYGLTSKRKPGLNGLHFVQIDEFYPISPLQHNSFYYYVKKFYVEGFGLDPAKALLINSEDIPLVGRKHFSEVFPGNIVDLSLRYREPKSAMERIQQESIFMIDNWCSGYEQKVREMGGIGFFLGGIGPDGHIAFNCKGSSHHSTTRLTGTNFETQAVAATDLGGIEISRTRLVITVGLETITFNPEVSAIIIAAGEAKAGIVKQALECEPSNLYPASVLQKLKHGRFYLTHGAAARLEDSVEKYYRTGEWNHRKTERAIIDLCKRIEKYGHRLLLDDLKEDKYCRLIPGLSLDTVQKVIDSMEAKFIKGMEPQVNQTYLHTGPHHDDIMLGILPHITHQFRSATNKFSFTVLTSGFTAVTNSFLKDVLVDTRKFLDEGTIQMVKYSDFFEAGYQYKWDKDIYHYLDKVASREPGGQKRGLSHRVVRAIVQIYKVKTIEELRDRINEILSIINKSYDGEKNPPQIQRLKGMIREFEEELVWAHYGVQVKNIHHLRLGFYTGDIFTEQPDVARDVNPVLELLREVKPTVLSLAFDPEGSGPDTHYKVLQTIAEALRLWSRETDLSNFRVWGYRNVWYRFHPAEADVLVPVSLNAMYALNENFQNCYISQVNASFPSYELDGHFCELARKIWVEQLKDMQLLLGKNYFYQNPHPRVRGTHGLLFFRDMALDEFLVHARVLQESMEGMAV